MGGYSVVFDVTETGYQHWGMILPGITALAVGLALMRMKEFLSDHPAIFYVIPIGTAIWGLFAFTATFADYSILAAELRHNKCEVTEGVVTSFSPFPYEGHQEESFQVDDQMFRYSDYELTAGFNRTASQGGPISEGKRVRIHHVGNRIAKLEMWN